MTRWLLTGGAGYIGAHVARDLLASGREVVVIDDLSTGHRDRVPAEADLVVTSVLDTRAVERALEGVAGVIHLAGKKAVGESVRNPLMCYRENVAGTMSLLEAMSSTGTRCLVYSSSASVYGKPSLSPIQESAPLVPMSPYGETKVIGEWLVRAEAVARANSAPLSWIALRYFNVAGAGANELGDTSAHNLIPAVFDALDRGEAPKIFGTDYPTPDGTCVRDYIHVSDLSLAHVAAADLTERSTSAHAINIGTGIGSSVAEVMNAISAAIGRDVGAEPATRRPGDPPELVAETTQATTILGWEPRCDLNDMAASAYSARKYPTANN